MAIRKPPKPRSKRKPQPTKRVSQDPTLWDDLAAIADSIPKKDRASLPVDGSVNLDHYGYGTPKEP